MTRRTGEHTIRLTVKTVFIYLLKCPISGTPRYVGKAVNPVKRLAQHLDRAGKRGGHLANWLSSLRRDGLKPVMEILIDVQEDEWQAMECAYIQFYREQGCPLVNGTEGGEGGKPKGSRMSLESRCRMKLAWARRSRKRSPESITKLKETLAFKREFGVM